MDLARAWPGCEAGCYRPRNRPYSVCIEAFQRLVRACVLCLAARQYEKEPRSACRQSRDYQDASTRRGVANLTVEELIELL